MNNHSFINRCFLLLVCLLTLSSLFSQSKNFSRIRNSKFPKSWDTKEDLGGAIIAWSWVKEDSIFEYRKCLTIVYGPDSIGNIEYFVSEEYTNESPFNEWTTSMIHYTPSQPDSSTGLFVGYWDIHIERFPHKPTKKEFYSLLNQWEFSFFEKGAKTLEAGIDDDLCLKILGFIPDRKILSKVN